jgi:type I restriction enzyme S subunit
VSAAWPSKTLAEVCEIRPPKSEAKRQLKDSDLVSFVPMEDLGIDQKFLEPNAERKLGQVTGSYTYFADGDVLLAKITPCFENGKLGIARGLTNGIGFGSSEYIVFRPNDELSREYLYYFLSQDSFRADGIRTMSGAVGHKRVSKEFIERCQIPLPLLAEQQRIVAILDEVFAGLATATANAEKNLKNARELFEAALVVDIFGNADEQRWEETTVAELALPERGSIRTGPFGSQLLHGEFVDDGTAVLGIDNAVANEFRWGKPRFITKEKFAQLSRYQVRPGDVLITIMGTCGRCAIVPDDIPVAINTKHLCCISLDQTRCLPKFLHAYFLYHPIARTFLAEQAKGSIMAGLNMGIIQRLPVRLPPMPQQRRIIEKMDLLSQETRRLEDNRLQRCLSYQPTLHRFRGAELGSSFEHR